MKLELDKENIGEAFKSHIENELKVILKTDAGELNEVPWGKRVRTETKADMVSLDGTLFSMQLLGNLKNGKLKDQLEISTRRSMFFSDELYLFLTQTERKRSLSKGFLPGFRRETEMTVSLSFRFMMVLGMTFTALIPSAKTIGYHKNQSAGNRIFQFSYLEVRMLLEELDGIPNENDLFNNQLRDVFFTFWFKAPLSFTSSDEQIKMKTFENFHQFATKKNSLFRSIG